MATTEEITEVRRMTGEVNGGTYTNEQIGAYIDEAGDLNLAASRIWREKAADYAEVVDITEAGSSRKNSALYKNAMEQAAYYEGQGGGDPTPVVGSYTTTRRIVRP